MKTLRLGDRDANVRVLQQKLNLKVDGIFGPMTYEGVLEFQKSHNLETDGIVGPATWGALLNLPVGNPRRIDKIIVHCSATPEGENFTVSQIKQAHLSRGFSDIGYHWYIDLDGVVHKGRDEAISGAHTTGYNSHSIGVCYCGGCPPRTVSGWQYKGKDTRTLAQKEALLKLLRQLKKRYPGVTIHGHREFANKACPSFDAAKEYAHI